MSLVCERCGKRFDETDAREEFEGETGKCFDYLTKTLCDECAIQAIEDKEDAFTKSTENIKVLNLGCPVRAAVLSVHGEVLETSMDDIELDIVRDYLKRNQRFMEGPADA